jgi:hypothetical protein
MGAKYQNLSRKIREGMIVTGFVWLKIVLGEIQWPFLGNQEKQFCLTSWATVIHDAGYFWNYAVILK